MGLLSHLEKRSRTAVEPQAEPRVEYGVIPVEANGVLPQALIAQLEKLGETLTKDRTFPERQPGEPASLRTTTRR